MIYAHSPGQDFPAQSYRDHILNVEHRAYINAHNVALFMSGKYDLNHKDLFTETVKIAARFHDLGKIDIFNQKILSGESTANKLPVAHEDAGTLYLKNLGIIGSAQIVYSHHKGLPSWPKEKVKEDTRKLGFRYQNEKNQKKENITLEHSNENIDNFLEKHKKAIPLPDPKKIENNFLHGLSARIALSCLVDADHGDTANHYNNEIITKSPYPRWKERLNNLDKNVLQLFNSNPSDRNKKRMDLYNANKNSDTSIGIRCCTNTVGSGKTTSIMAHLLKVAADNELRRIFIVLPFTNIITQTVEVYRKMLVLPDENPDHVIAELHHKVDFESKESRRLASLWEAPIIVTTAVSFFETLGSSKTGALRKLHSLPGSAVFIDEAHTAIPINLWPITWDWINDLSENWSCHWVLASGSLSKFWTIKKFFNNKKITDITPYNNLKKTNKDESQRIKYSNVDRPLPLSNLYDLIISNGGPRLVVVNTVQTAAVIARYLKNKKHDVLHISTALTPLDREIIIKKIKDKLEKKEKNWTLVGTTCIEAGIDLSFFTGFREKAGFCNLIQLGGRINRNNENSCGIVYDFTISDPLCIKHPSFTKPARILDRLWKEEKIKKLNEGELSISELATESLRRELYGDLNGEKEIKKILKLEESGDFPELSTWYKVIDSDTRLVIIDQNLINDIESNKKVDKLELVKNSIQLWGYKIDKLGLPNFNKYPEIYKWVYKYDPCFLGYMEGILGISDFELDGFLLI